MGVLGQAAIFIGAEILAAPFEAFRAAADPDRVQEEEGDFALAAGLAELAFIGTPIGIAGDVIDFVRLARASGRFGRNGAKVLKETFERAVRFLDTQSDVRQIRRFGEGDPITADLIAEFDEVPRFSGDQPLGVPESRVATDSSEVLPTQQGAPLAPAPARRAKA